MSTSPNPKRLAILLTCVIAINFLLLWGGWSAFLARLLPASSPVASGLTKAIAFGLAFACVGLLSWLCRSQKTPQTTETADLAEIEDASHESLPPADDAPPPPPAYAKRTFLLALAACCIVTLTALYNGLRLSLGAPTKAYAEQAATVQEEVASLAKALFSETPPKDSQMRQIMVFSTTDEDFTKSMHARFPDLRDFPYSLLGMLLRGKKEQLSLLQRDYHLTMTWRNSHGNSRDFLIPYVLVTAPPKGDQAPTCELIFAIDPASGRLLLEGSSVNGLPFLDFLSILRTGEFTRKQAEYAFLEELKPLMP